MSKPRGTDGPELAPRARVALILRSGERPVARLAAEIATRLDAASLAAADVSLAAVAVAADDAADPEVAAAMVTLAGQRLAVEGTAAPRAANPAPGRGHDFPLASELALARAALAARAGRRSEATILAAFAVATRPASPPDEHHLVLVSPKLVEAVLAAGDLALAGQLLTGDATWTPARPEFLATMLSSLHGPSLRAACSLLRLAEQGEHVLNALAAPAADPALERAWEQTFTSAMKVRACGRLVETVATHSPLRTTARLLEGLILARAVGDVASCAALPRTETIRRASPSGMTRTSPLYPLFEVARWLEELEAALADPLLATAHFARAEELFCRVERVELETLARAAAARAAAGTCGTPMIAALLQGRAAAAAKLVGEIDAAPPLPARLARPSRARAVESSRTPTGLRRASAIGKVAALLAGAALRGRTRNVTDYTAFAAALKDSLGKLKGPMMKTGQLAAFMAPALPPEVREALASLHFQGCAMAPGLAHQIVGRELGPAYAEAFARWDETPLAVASIGQVHRAALRDGTEVVVKVQHPAIERAAKMDLRLLKLMGAIGATYAPGIVGKKALAEHERLRLAEMDYRYEAAMQARFAAVLAGEADVVVPAVFPALSTRRVLTSTFAPGERLTDFAATASQTERDRLGGMIFRTIFHGILTHGVFNTDIHPGNFLVDGDRLVVLDFGAAIELSPAEVDGLRALCASLWSADDDAGIAAFTAICADAGIVQPSGFDARANMRLLHETFGRPVRGGPFQFTQAFLASETNLFLRHNPNLMVTVLPPRLLHFMRLIWGMHGILANLGAMADWREIGMEVMASPRAFKVA